MNTKVLHPEVQQLILNEVNCDIATLLFKKPFFENITNQEIAEQIVARKKCEKKLPTWFRTSGIYYPNKLNIEQTSSEITAAYKSSIINGNTLLDLTGGLGVDSFFFSKKLGKVVHSEKDTHLSKIAEHNFKILKAPNIQTFTGDGLKFLKETKLYFDWLYLDPSRRDNDQNRVFQLADCIPNILDHLEFLFSKAKNILLKTAPFMDISFGMKQLTGIKKIHIVAVKNEVKELLWVLERNFQGEPEIVAVNIEKSYRQTFEFYPNEENSTTSEFSKPLTYLYEPNSAILKSGSYKILGPRMNVKKIHRHTHLYTSEKLLDFPGRRFKILNVFPYKRKTIRELPVLKANITTRNFPESVAQIRKKFKIKEGGDTYLFFATDIAENLIVIRCSKA